MINILLSGCTGGMGQSITKLIATNIYNIDIICGVGDENIYTYYPIYNNFIDVPSDIVKNIDVVLDFSHPLRLNDILNFSVDKSIPLVLCTTGYTDIDLINIKKSSEEIPIFISRNMSVGVNLIRKLIACMKEDTLKNYDIEIIEKHHHNKMDAPSGTALLFANDINRALNNNYTYNYSRYNENKKREQKEIGIHSVRCGNIPGEHEIILCSGDEEIIISHKAYSKDVFSKSSLNAVDFIHRQKNGIYKMKDIL